MVTLLASLAGISHFPNLYIVCNPIYDLMRNKLSIYLSHHQLVPNALSAQTRNELSFLGMGIM